MSTEKTARQAQFISKFNCNYLRVHRGDGMKSVLCFPCCKPGGHKVRTFCGQNVQLLMHASLPKGSLVCGHIRIAKNYAFAYAVDQVVTKKSIKARFYEHPCEPSYMVQGQLHKDGSSIMDFDPQCHVRTGDNPRSPKEKLRLWHYEWAITRQNHDDRHVFTAYIFRPHGTKGDMKLCGRIESTPFAISTRSRKKKAQHKRKLQTTNKTARQQCGTKQSRVRVKMENVANSTAQSFTQSLGRVAVPAPSSTGANIEIPAQMSMSTEQIQAVYLLQLLQQQQRLQQQHQQEQVQSHSFEEALTLTQALSSAARCIFTWCRRTPDVSGVF